MTINMYAFKRNLCQKKLNQSQRHKKLIRFRLISFMHSLISCFMSCLIGSALFINTAAANTAGLPFTEPFDDQDLQDSTYTTANWNTDAGVVELPAAIGLVNPLNPDTNTNRRFGSSSSSEPRWGLSAADINGDGFPDLVTAIGVQTNNSTSSDSVRIHLHRATSGFPYRASPSIRLGEPANDDTRSIAIADVDLDGDMDIVAGNLGTNRLFRNDSPTNPFVNNSALGLDSADMTYGVALVDVNGDDYADLVVANNGTNHLLLNDANTDNDDNPFTNGISLSFAGIARDSRAINVADINADGAPDIIFANNGAANRLYLHSGNPNTPYSAGIEFGGNEGTRDLAVADFDNDGDIDVAEANLNAVNFWYENNNGTLSTNPIPLSNDDRMSTAIVAADFDTDGDIDVAIGNQDGVYQLLLNDVNNGGDMPLQNVIATEIANNSDVVSGLAVLDTNRDSIPDLWSSLTNIRGRGFENNPSSDAAAFNLNSEIQVSFAPDDPDAFQRSIDLADVNRDGLLDMAIGVTNDLNGTIRPSLLFINDGDDTPFSNQPQNIPNGINNLAATQELHLIDVNHDSYLDAVLINIRQTNQIYLHNQTNTPYANVVPIEWGDDLLIETAGFGDVNRDGLIDVITDYNLSESTPKLYLNSGSAPFYPTEMPLPLGDDGLDPTQDGFTVLIEDFNYDGFPDVVATSISASRPSKLFLHNQTLDQAANPYTDTPLSIDTPDSSRTTLSAITLDADRDGRLDVLLGNIRPPRGNQLFLNDGSDMAFAGVAPFDLTDDDFVTRTMQFADFDRDGQIEIAQLDPLEDDDVMVEFAFTDGNLNHTLQNFNQTLPDGSPLDNFKADIGDVDHDGDLDLVITERDALPRTYFLRNDQTPQPFVNPDEQTVGNDNSNSQNILLVDINIDGYPDLISANGNASNTVTYSNRTATPYNGVNNAILPSPTGSADNSFDVTAADFDLDGDPDLMFATDGSNYLLLNDDDSNPFDTATPLTVDSGIIADSRGIASGDIDGDGDDDVVIANADSSNVLHINTRSAAILATGQAIPDTGGSARNSQAVALADINLDGRLDLVVANANQADQVYLNTGSSPYFVTAIDLPSSNGNATAITIADLDRDGDNDIAIAQAGTANRSYIYNRNTQTFTGANIGAETDDSTDITAIDIDYDSHIDIIVSNNGQTDKIYLNNGTAAPFNNAAVTAVNLDTANNTSMAIAIADVNFNGLNDIVVATNNQNYWYERTVAESGDITGFNLSRNLAGSISVDDTNDNIDAILLTVTEDTPPNTEITYWVSNDGGATYFAIVPGIPLTFPTTGSDLRWRAELTSLSAITSPRIEQLNLSQPGADNPPTSSGIADIEVEANAATISIDLTTVFDDDNTRNDQLIFSIANAGDTTLVDVSINSNNELVIDFIADAVGTTNIIVQATDNNSQSTPASFAVTINQPTAAVNGNERRYKSSGGGASDWLSLVVLLTLLSLGVMIRYPQIKQLGADKRLVKAGQKSVAITALACIFLTSQVDNRAMAEGFMTEGFYVSAAVGSSQSHNSEDDFTHDLQNRGHDVRVSNADRSEFAWFLRAGYQWQLFGIEASVVELGDFTTEFSGSTDNQDQLADDIADLQPIGGRGVNVSGTVGWPINERFTVKGKAGLAYLLGSDVELTLDGEHISRRSSNEWAPTLGANLQIKLAKQHSLGIEAQHYFISRDDVTTYLTSYIFEFSLK